MSTVEIDKSKDSDNAQDIVDDDDNKDINNAQQQQLPQPPQSPPPQSPPPILKKKETRSVSNADILKKLRNILDGVASQEADLKRKTHKIEEWYNLHQEGLNLASITKKKLIEYEPVNDLDDQETKSLKAKNKTEINKCLDNLEQQLKKINLSEKKYRSRESIQEKTELNETIKKLQNKYKILSTKYNQQISDIEKLTKQNQENENKIKSLTESHKKSVESLKKELHSKHKNYIHNLQSQHESLLKKQKDQHTKNAEKIFSNEKNSLNSNIESLETEIDKLKRENLENLNKKLKELRKEKDLEIDKLSLEIEKGINDYQILENKLKEKQEEISEFELREKAHKELMLKWQAQKEKKNEKINELTESITTLNIKIENLESQNQKLQETTALNSIQMTQRETQFNELDTKHNEVSNQLQQMDKDKKLLEAKLKVSIKEIIKLRQEVKDKDENKSVILTELSNMEIEKNKKVKDLTQKINDLNNEVLLLNKEFSKSFQSLNANLNDVHSKLESFSVTIRNFSGDSLKQIYDTELEARKKSNEELPAWQDNIREQVRRANEQMTINGISTITNNGNNNDEESKQNEIIHESETQIAHIKLTGLQILAEYTALLLEYNDLYISTNNNVNSNKKKPPRRKPSHK